MTRLIFEYSDEWQCSIFNFVVRHGLSDRAVEDISKAKFEARNALEDISKAKSDART